MKQVLQDVRTGEVRVDEVPEPAPRPGWVLIQVERSLISSGTERSLVDLGAASMLGKARARPDLVRKVVAVARTEGVQAASDRVRSRLDRATELGYSVAGTVLDTGGLASLSPGQRVAAVGAGYAVHAGVVAVPANLVVPVPDDVSTEAAAFAAPAAIALHGFRLANAGPGSVVAIVGLGLVGQLAVRVAAAAGVTVAGTDPVEDRRRLAASVAGVEAAGADDFEPLVERLSRGRGADAVLVCAAARSAEPVALAAAVARDRATVVCVGDVPVQIDRRIAYEKELSVVVSRSYGAGRYDRDYEEGGRDLPAGYVRWTEGRNVEAVLDLIARGSLAVEELVTHRFSIEDAPSAYEALEDGALGIALEFTPAAERRKSVTLPVRRKDAALRIAVVGAGAFARSMLVPALESLDVAITAVVARTGPSATSLATRIGAGTATTDWRDVVERADVDALVVATPHAEHAEIAAAGLEAGKSVFVEKPLAVDRTGLDAVAAAARRSDGVLLVGHNRRFAPFAAELRSVGTPAVIVIRVAAAPIPADHWLRDPEQGGRVLGEISHFVDLAAAAAGDAPDRVYAVEVRAADGTSSLVATLAFASGSAATIAYAVADAPGLPKELVEAHGPGGVAIVGDFRTLEVRRPDGARRAKGRRDKGHRDQLAAFVAAALGRAPLPVSLDEQLRVAAASLLLIESAASGLPLVVEI